MQDPDTRAGKQAEGEANIQVQSQEKVQGTDEASSRAVKVSAAPVMDADEEQKEPTTEDEVSLARCCSLEERKLSGNALSITLGRTTRSLSREATHTMVVFLHLASSRRCSTSLS